MDISGDFLGFEGDGAQPWDDALNIGDDLLQDLYSSITPAPSMAMMQDIGVPLELATEDLSDSQVSRKRTRNRPATTAPTPYTSFSNIDLAVSVGPPRADPSNARNEITTLTQAITRQDDQMKQLLQMQYAAINANDPAQLLVVQQHVVGIGNCCGQQVQLIDTVEAGTLLDPGELAQTRLLRNKVNTQIAQLDLLRRELEWVANGRGPKPCFAALVIDDQPLSQVLFKGKSCEDSYVVRLLAGSTVDFQRLGEVTCEISAANPTWKSKKPLLNDTCSLEAFQRNAVFSHLKANISTRMNLISFKFSTEVTPNTAQHAELLTTADTAPVIVITNESQWADGSGKLILAETFPSQRSMSWQKFANIVHRQFLKNTRQDERNPARRLQLADLHYVYNRFFTTDTVTSQQAVRFLAWFMPVVQSIRFKRHISSMWFQGLIFGFVDKERCNAALSSYGEGTFLIRFSESNPGLFAVAYVSDDKHDRVKHYLVKPEDTSVNCALPDFLATKRQFEYLLKLDFQTYTMTCLPKDQFLGQYYMNKPQTSGQKTNGYVLL